MAPRPNNENAASTTAARGKRNHIQSSRARLQNSNDKEDAARKAELKQKKKERAERHQVEAEKEARVSQPGDSNEVRQLRELLDRTTNERDAAVHNLETRMQETPVNDSATQGSIPQPSNLSRTAVKTIREHMGLAERKDKPKWNAGTIRSAMTAAMLEHNITWKGQTDRKSAKVYAAWATQFLAHQSFGNQRAYAGAQSNPNTYHGRKAFARLNIDDAEGSGNVSNGQAGSESDDGGNDSGTQSPPVGIPHNHSQCLNYTSSMAGS
ncbi:hypothetical protein BT96DRAFT_940807 [Gymnopus androsaceus JB14]|uniref:Uncharacterized protein n=1 Tax=Gymnopus androsaceus JB14 TaxID=1447944 RepID=A0A6A4HJ38_9AGAR|nr:hypothetical protein BT96DRAFT_940807 [Gymnopus androsaceus JB14]